MFRSIINYFGKLYLKNSRASLPRELIEFFDTPSVLAQITRTPNLDKFAADIYGFSAIFRKLPRIRTSWKGSWCDVARINPDIMARQSFMSTFSKINPTIVKEDAPETIEITEIVKQYMYVDKDISMCWNGVFGVVLNDNSESGDVTYKVKLVETDKSFDFIINDLYDFLERIIEHPATLDPTNVIMLQTVDGRRKGLLIKSIINTL